MLWTGSTYSWAPMIYLTDDTSLLPEAARRELLKVMSAPMGEVLKAG